MQTVLFNTWRLVSSVTPHHNTWLPHRRCQTYVSPSANLLPLIDPLPLDRLSRHTVTAISSWPATDRHHILAVANRDLRVARQNLVELQLYVDDHAAHVANCATADDDDIPLMSAETFPRLDGGIRAALDEADSL